MEVQVAARSRHGSGKLWKRPCSRPPVVVSRVPKDQHIISGDQQCEFTERGSVYKAQSPSSHRCQCSSKPEEEASQETSQHPVHRNFLKSGQPDLNDEFTRKVYTQIAEFRVNAAREDIIFKYPDHSMQDLLHALARLLNLEYEYSLPLRIVRISRTLPDDDESLSAAADPDYSCFDGSERDLDDVFEFSQSNCQTDNYNLSLQNGLPTDPEGHLSGDTTKWLLPFSDSGINLSPADSFSQTSHRLSNSQSQVTGTSINPAWTMHNSEAPEEDYYQSIDDFLCDPQDTNSNDPLENTNTETSQHPSANTTLELQAPGKRTAGPVIREFTFVQEEGIRKYFESVTSEDYKEHPDRQISAALKIGEACWKCRILRKKCDKQSQCQECQKGELGSTWQEIGCRRGTLESHLLPVEHYLTFTTTSIAQSSKVCVSGILTISQVSAMEIQPTECRWPPHRISKLQDPKRLMEEAPTLLGDAFLKFLNTSFRGAFRCSFELFLNVCYQVSMSSLENSSLISKVIRCLYICREFSCSAQSIPLNEQTTVPVPCVAEAIRSFQKHFQEYIRELYRAIFKKQHLRGDRAWCIPAFLSLCVLGIIRRVLLKGNHVGECIKRAFQQCIDLTLRLFLATSSTFDPLLENEKINEPGDYNYFDWLMVESKYWKENGFSTSSTVLRQLFYQAI